MFEKIAVWIACSLLQRSLSIEQKNILVRGVLNSLQALPLQEIFSYNEDRELLVGGKIVTPEFAKILSELAGSALDNKALTLIREQVTYEAIVNGVFKTTRDEGQLFMRAALWWEQETRKHLETLSGRSLS